MRAPLVIVFLFFAAISTGDAGGAERDDGAGFALRVSLATPDPWRARVEKARLRYEAFAARAQAAYLAYSGESARRLEASPGIAAALAPVLDDPTLRLNDIYVAQDGVLLFRGRSGPPHRAADFVRMSDARVEALSLKIDVRMK